MKIQLFLSIALVLMGCGGDGLDNASELKGYRILAVESDLPTVNFIDQPTISVIDYHPDMLSGKEIDISYQWQLCPFSIGSSAQYECLIPDIDLEGNGPSIKINLPTLLQEALSQLPAPANAQGEANMMMDPSKALEGLSGLLPPEAADLSSGIDLYVKLKATLNTSKESFSAVKKIKLNIDPSKAQNNQNPSLTAIRLLPQLQSYKTNQEITLEAVIDEEQQESYQIYYTANINDKPVQKQEEKTEAFVLSWFSSSGSWEDQVTLLTKKDNILTLGNEAGKARIYVKVTDGRGGVDIKYVDINVEK
jgi:hypothetical protein